MNKFQLFVFFCNTYNALLCNGVDLNEVDKFLLKKAPYFHPDYPLDPRDNMIISLDKGDINRAIGIMIGGTPCVRINKGEKYVDFDAWDRFRQRFNKIKHKRKITFKDEVEFFGHTKWDYKADGTFRKGREDNSRKTTWLPQVVAYRHPPCQKSLF